MRIAEFKKLKVREIMEMIKEGKLKYNQSTQRKFVYASIPVILNSGKTTKAGKVINAILERDIALPSLTFWKNTDTNQLNVHDGKQRILSIYYFIKPSVEINVTTILNGREYLYDGLSTDLKEKLLNYEFTVQINEGTTLEEEKNFDAVNSNALPLTKYECLSGMLYGTFLREFESYIEELSKNFDTIKPINRGEQAYKILITMFDLKDSKQAGEDTTNLELKNRLRPLRNNAFRAEDFEIDKILVLFNDLMHIIKGIHEDRALAIANYIIRNNFNITKIIDYYKEVSKNTNDIVNWDIDTHTTAIKSLIYDNKKLDGKRYFTNDIKDVLYSRNSRCAHIEIDNNGNTIRCNETNYSKLTVDHIIPWSKGGRTILDNAQLLCKSHNSSKGNSKK